MRLLLKSETPLSLKVYGEVYVPYRMDTDGEFATPEDIEKAAHWFMKQSRMGNIDTEHNDRTVWGDNIVESYIAKENDPDGYIPGSWIAASLLTDPIRIEKVKKGELNGYSMAGKSRKVPRTVRLTALVKAENRITDPVEVNGESHVHTFEISFDKNGKVFPSVTSAHTDGHTHDIRRTTATEMSKGENAHAHRYDIAWKYDDPDIEKEEREQEAIQLTDIKPRMLSLVSHGAMRRGFSMVKSDGLPDLEKTGGAVPALEEFSSTENAAQKSDPEFVEFDEKTIITGTIIKKEKGLHTGYGSNTIIVRNTNLITVQRFKPVEL